MNIPFFSFLKSANTNISPFIQPQDQPSVLNGVTNSWKLGALTKDTGYSIIDAQIQANKSITGMFHFVQNPSTEKMLVTVDDSTSDDTQLFYRANGAGSWTEIGAAETAWANVAGCNVEMANFIGYCFFVGYSAVDGFLPVGSLTGTTFSTSTNVTSMPQAKYIVNYRDRLYALNVKYGGTEYPYRIVCSSPPSAGAITWSTSGSPTSSTGGFLDVSFNLEITGGAENWDRLMIFTNRSAYFYDQTQFKKIWDQGCSNHRTICTEGAYMIWVNGKGVWVSTGGQPQNIAGEVIDFIRNGNPANFFAEIVDEVYHLYVGTVTVNGVTYTNCVLKFNIPISTWEWREYANNMTVFEKYLNSSRQERLYMGDTTGKVWDKGKYTDATLVSGDAQTTAGTGGTDISANFELAPIVLNNYSDVKVVKNIIAYSERAQGLKLKMRVIDKNTRILTPYRPIGELTHFINSFQVNVDKGCVIQIAGAESSTNPYFSFYGFDLEVEKYSKTLKPSKK